MSSAFNDHSVKHIIRSAFCKSVSVLIPSHLAGTAEEIHYARELWLKRNVIVNFKGSLQLNWWPGLTGEEEITMANTRPVGEGARNGP